MHVTFKLLMRVYLPPCIHVVSVRFNVSIWSSSIPLDFVVLMSNFALITTFKIDYLVPGIAREDDQVMVAIVS